MILIADGGSTKTTWAVLDNGECVQKISSCGINPFYQTEEEIALDIKKNLVSKLDMTKTFKAIYFYGAGCIFPKNIQSVRNALAKHLRSSKIEIYSDLLAVARALLCNEKGIACILGTGSNSCYYDGKKITQHVSPLGFILGDEGSGAVLGKLLIGDILKKQLPDDIIAVFYRKYKITQVEIQENVYKKSFPNRYLAQFCVFLHENKENKAIRELIANEFTRFFDRNIRQYSLSGRQIGFVGSVAYYFKEILQETAESYGFDTIKICRNPLKGLIKFHA